MRTLLFINLFIAHFLLQAQNAKEDFAKINEAYSINQNLSFNIEYLAYETYASSTPIDKQYGFYKRQGENIYNGLGGIENLTTPAETIVIDSANKKLMVKPTFKSANNNTSNITMVDLDKLLYKYKKIAPVSKNKNERGYTLEFQDKVMSDYSKVEVYFSTKTYLITSLVFYYRAKFDFSNSFPAKTGDKPKLEIKFTNIDTSPSFKEDEFLASHFVIGKRGSRKASSKYKGYSISEQK